MYYDGKIHIEEDDQCYSCEYHLKGVTCPLLEALAVGVVELNDEIAVTNCGFYRKFERHLRVVETDQPPEDSAEDEHEYLSSPDISFTPEDDERQSGL